MSKKIKLSYAMMLVYCLPTVIAIGVAVLSVLSDVSIGVLIGILGGVFSLRYLNIAFIMLGNYLYLKKRNLIDEMTNETPTVVSKLFGISDNYIFSYQHNLALPLRYISKVAITKQEYVNSVKGHCGLVVTMQGGKKFVFFHYSGMPGKKRMEMLTSIAALINRKISK